MAWRSARTGVFPETLASYIIVDMFAKAIQGMKPEDAVAWAAGELRKVYEA